MLAFILFPGKEFSLPDGVSAAIIGLFFGLICGLFYYQHYAKSWFWAFSLGGGLIFTIISNASFARLRATDNYIGIGSTIASFAIPFLLTLALNHGLHRIKRKNRIRRKQQPKIVASVDLFSGTEHAMATDFAAKDTGA